MIENGIQVAQWPRRNAHPITLPEAPTANVLDGLKPAPDQINNLVGNNGRLIPQTGNAPDARHPGDRRAWKGLEIETGKEIAGEIHNPVRSVAALCLAPYRRKIGLDPTSLQEGIHLALFPWFGV
jgi:hypothetical protein